MVRIPEEYQEVEYLESTDGTGQYIDTGIILTDSTSVKVRFNLPSKTSYGSSFGSRYNSFCISRMQNHEYFVAEIYGRPTTLSKFRYTQNEWVDAELHMTQCVLNGTVYEIQRGTTVTSYPIWMFGKSKSYAAALDVKNACKISYLQIYEDDFMAANFIPCYRKSDNEAGMYDTVSGTFYTNNGTGTFLVGNPVEYSTISLLEARRRILLNTPHLESLSGAMASFETDMSAKLKECKIHFTPIQEGTGDPSPENVRPITGWDGIKVTRCGKNLVDVQDMKDTYPWSSSPTYKSYCLFVGANKTVTVSCASAPPSGKDFYLILSGNAEQKDKSQGYWMYHSTSPTLIYDTVTVTVDSNGYLYITLLVANIGLSNFYDYILDNQFQVEYGNMSTDYEPYTAQSLTIPFPKTIYGGYVDLVKGEVVEEIDSEGQQITPNTYSITPQTIRTLKGLNSIWSDANGNIELKFWTH